ncbi:unnamed protein product [Rhizophagus irregularis]|nr:unnamed protein product [Rhizophagus irregularis]CAB5371759.1 unnamed protein product [Rhizophagus irregularis]
MQAFLTTPKYNKFYIYKTPTTPYQRFCNAFGYHRMKKAAETINATNMKLAELQRIYNSTNDLEIRNNLLERMATLKQTLHDEDNKIKKLKRHAEYQR